MRSLCYVTTYLFVLIVLDLFASHTFTLSNETNWPKWEIVNAAHRGGISEGYSENTLSNFQRAIELGVDVIEIDLRSAKGGEVVILHDKSLDRTTNGNGNVGEHSLQELRRLDAGNGERIPTLEETLDLVVGTRVKLLLDIKPSPDLDYERVVRTIEEYGRVLDVIVGVRTVKDLKAFRKLNPNLRTLGFIPLPQEAQDFIGAGVDIVRLWQPWILEDTEIVGKIHAQGRPVWAGIPAGFGSESEIEELVILGVNGVLSDTPEVLISLVRDPEDHEH